MTLDPKTNNINHCQYCRVARLCLPMAIDDLPRDMFNDVVTKRIELEKGNVLFDIGDTFTSFYAVKEGAFKLFSITQDGREQITSFYFTGELIGFDAVESGYYNGCLQAIEKSSLCELSYNKLLLLSNSSPSLQRYIIKLMSQRINYDRCIRSNAQASERLAAFLLNFTARMERSEINQTQFHLPLNRTDIGNFLGLSSETISRHLSVLQQQHILSCSGKSLIIHDYRALQRLSCQPNVKTKSIP